MIWCLRLTAPVPAKNPSRDFAWMKLNIQHIMILCIGGYCYHRMALFTKVYHKHSEKLKEGSLMSHLDCSVYAACVSKEHSVQTVYFLFKHTANLTEGNILRHTRTGGGEGVECRRVRDHSLCCRKGHVGLQITPILCYQYLEVHPEVTETMCSTFILCIYVYVITL